MADDEPALRSVLTREAWAAGYVVADDAAISADVVESLDGEIRMCVARIECATRIDA